LELILAVAVNSAALQDRDGAKLLLPGLLNFGWVRKVFADGGYAEHACVGNSPGDELFTPFNALATWL
jgi:hypothetical protein